MKGSDVCVKNSKKKTNFKFSFLHASASNLFSETNCKAHLKLVLLGGVGNVTKAKQTVLCLVKKTKAYCIPFMLLGWLEVREFPFYFSILGGQNPLYPPIHSIHPYLCFRQRKWSLCLQILYIFLKISMSHNLIDFHIAVSIIYSAIYPKSIFLAT